MSRVLYLHQSEQTVSFHLKMYVIQKSCQLSTESNYHLLK